MPHARQHALRRRLAVLVLGVLTVIAAEVSLPVSSLAPGTATAVADSGGTYDRSLRPGECALLGRAYATGLGCARDRCVEGAVPWRKVAGAEACARVGQPKGFGYAATVGVRQLPGPASPVDPGRSTTAPPSPTARSRPSAMHLSAPARRAST